MKIKTTHTPEPFKITVSTPWIDERWGYEISVRTPDQVVRLLSTGVDYGYRFVGEDKWELIELAESAARLMEDDYARFLAAGSPDFWNHLDAETAVAKAEGR